MSAPPEAQQMHRKPSLRQTTVEVDTRLHVDGSVIDQ